MRNIDFLPQSYRQTRQRRAMRIRRLWLGAACLGALAVWFAVDEVRLHRTRAQLDYLASQNQTVRTSLEHIRQLQTEQAALLGQYQLIRELQPAVSCVSTICRVAELLPEQVALRQLQITSATASAGQAEAGSTGTTGPAGKKQAAGPTPMRLTLSGLAPSQVDIAVLVGHLSSCREFANVRLDYTKAAEIDSRQAHEFRVTFDVLAPVADARVSAGVTS